MRGDFNRQTTASSGSNHVAVNVQLVPLVDPWFEIEITGKC